MNIQIAISLALFSAFLWGLGPVLYKQFYNNCSAYTGYILDALFGSLIILLPFALLGQPKYEALLSAILLTAPYSFSYLLFLMSFDLGDVTLVSVVAHTYPIVTMLLAFSLGGEPLLPMQLSLILIIIICSMLIGLAKNGPKFGFSESKEWFVLAAITALMSGIGDYFLDEAVALYEVPTMTLAIFLTQIIVSGFLLIIFHKQVFQELKCLKQQPKLLISGLLASLAMSVGAISFYQAFKFGSASLVSSIAALEPVFAVVLACAFLKEKLNSLQVVLTSITLGILILLML